jgi:hypothetical protein
MSDRLKHSEICHQPLIRNPVLGTLSQSQNNRLPTVSGGALTPFMFSHQVMFALRELTGSLLALIEMVVYCSFCNEHFSFTMLHFIKVQPQLNLVTADSFPCRCWENFPLLPGSMLLLITFFFLIAKVVYVHF